MNVRTDLDIFGNLTLNTLPAQTNLDVLTNSSGLVGTRTLGSMALEDSSSYLTNVSISLPAIFNVTDSTAVPGDEDLVAAFNNQSANTVFAAPDGLAGTPTFRQLVVDDIDATGTADSTTFLRGDGVWDTPLVGNFAYGNTSAGGTLNFGNNLSVSKPSTGTYNFTFPTTNAPDSNYTVLVTFTGSAANVQDWTGIITTKSTTGFTVVTTSQDNGGTADPPTDLEFDVAVIGPFQSPIDAPSTYVLKAGDTMTGLLTLDAGLTSTGGTNTLGETNITGNLDVSGQVQGTLEFVDMNEPGITLLGSNGQYNIGVQDGNGRIQHKWNATYGTSENYISSDVALKWELDPVTPATDLFRLDYAAAGTGGNPITWTTALQIGDTTFEWMGNTVYHSGNESSITITESQISDLQSYLLNVSGQDHTTLANIGTNSHAQIDSHIADSTIHFTQASISITESQISDLQPYLLAADLVGYVQTTDIDTLAELNAIITDATLIDTNDSRLSDARTPLAHTHVVADITDFPTGLVDVSGTPSAQQLAIFTDSNTVEGNSNLTLTANELLLNNRDIQIDADHVIKVGPWSNLSAPFNMALGFDVNTSLISGMDFHNNNSNGQVRLMARADDDNYLVMNMPGSTVTSTWFGLTRGNAGFIFLQSPGGARDLGIGTLIDGNLVLGTDGVRALTIDPSQNVGIGTASPSTKLDVNGVITATGGNSTNWNTAYGWGDHASAGYLSSVDLGYTASTRTITNTGGTNAVLPLFTSTDAGLVPLSGGGTTNFLRADGTWAAPPGGGGASQLSDLSDVNTSTPTNRNVLVADGVDWESRALVEADISDLGSYLSNVVEDTTPQLGGDLDAQNNDITSLNTLSFGNGDSISDNSASTRFTMDTMQIWSTGIQNQIQVYNGSNFTNLSFNNATATRIIEFPDSSGTLALESWVTSQGYVLPTGTPADNQIAIWTNATTIEGSSNLTFDGATFSIEGASGTPSTANSLFSLRDTTSNIGFQIGAEAGRGWIRSVDVLVAFQKWGILSLGEDFVSLGDGLDEDQLYLNTNTKRLGLGTTTPSTKLDVDGVITATGGNSANWNTAFSWGDHSTQGYLTSISGGDHNTLTNIGTNTHAQIDTHIADTDVHVTRKVGFAAKNSVTSMSASTFTRVTFTTEIEDTDSAWNGSVFTVPTGQGGIYEIFGHATFSSVTDGNRAIVGVEVNGVLADGALLGRGVSGGTNLNGYGGAVRLELAAGDELEMVVWCENATSLFNTNGYTTFSAYKMR